MSSLVNERRRMDIIKASFPWYSRYIHKLTYYIVMVRSRYIEPFSIYTWKSRYDTRWFNKQRFVSPRGSGTSVSKPNLTFTRKSQRRANSGRDKHSVSGEPLISCSNTPAATLTSDARCPDLRLWTVANFWTNSCMLWRHTLLEYSSVVDLYPVVAYSLFTIHENPELSRPQTYLTYKISSTPSI